MQWGRAGLFNPTEPCWTGAAQLIPPLLCSTDYLFDDYPFGSSVFYLNSDPCSFIHYFIFVLPLHCSSTCGENFLFLYSSVIAILVSWVLFAQGRSMKVTGSAIYVPNSEMTVQVHPVPSSQRRSERRILPFYLSLFNYDSAYLM